jgi:SWI/SNF-related matrix-associated actin-dependent regulator 1 of chromatin subfamily A
MIRRLKSEVLTDLPDKLRQKIVVDSDSKYTKQINAILASMGSSAEMQMMEDGDDNESFIKCYTLTGQAKVESVKEYIDEIMENDVKVLIFGHHKFVLDEIETFLNQKKIATIRIDGQTSSELRFDRVQ